MIIFDYSFTNTGGGGRSRLKDAVHSIPNFFKKKYTAFKISNIAIQIHRLNVCMWFCVNDY